MQPIRAVLFDMIGTTVLEKDPTFISSCFQRAFLQQGISIDKDQIRTVRGMDKKEAIELILNVGKHPANLKQPIFEAFHKSVSKGISNFVEHHELANVIHELRQRSIHIGIASGLSQEIFELLFEAFEWGKYSFDYCNVYEKFPHGRPHPAMIHDMCETLKIAPIELLKVGDTVADIEEGKNAGTITAAILSGTQEESVLRKASPDHLLKSLIDVSAIIAQPTI